MASNDEVIRLALELTGSSDIEEASRKMQVLKKSTEEVAVATEKMGSKVAGTGQSLLQGGRVVQDFAQGGLGGVLNNIEGLTMALGMGPGLAGVLTVLGVVALVAGPRIKSAFAGWSDGSNDIPKSTDALTRLTDALKANNDALDDMRKKQSLTNTEIGEFNKLLATNVQLEKDLKAAKEQRQIIEKLAAIKPVGQDDRDRERAQNVQAEVGGNQAAITGEVAQGMKDAEARGIDQEMNRVWPAGQAWGDLSEAAQQRYHELVQRQAAHQRGMPEDLVAGAKEKVGRAAISGTDKDLRDVLDFLPRNSRFRPGLQGATDAGMEKQDAADAEFQGQLDERSAAVKRRNAKKKLNDDVKAAEDAAAEGAAEIEEAERNEGIGLGRKADKANIAHDNRQRADAAKRVAEAIKDQPGLSKQHLAEGDAALKARYQARLAEQRVMGIPDKVGPVRTQRPRRFLKGPNPGRAKAHDQETGPTAMDVAKPLGDIVAHAIANTGNQQQQIRTMLEQLRIANNTNTANILSDRSALSNGFPA
jgi:hypothetical protein